MTGSATCEYLLQGLQGCHNPCQAGDVRCRQLDGALNVELFAFYPAAAVQGILAASVPSLGLGIGQIQLLQGYLYWVCQNFVVPTSLYGGPTGQPLGPTAGGLLVRRSVFDWLNGTLPPHILFLHPHVLLKSRSGMESFIPSAQLPHCRRKHRSCRAQPVCLPNCHGSVVPCSQTCSQSLPCVRQRRHSLCACNRHMSAGWRDPLLQQNVSMAFAWPANDTASAVLGKPTEQLSWTDSPLIFQYNISTGRARGREPFDVSTRTSSLLCNAVQRSAWKLMGSLIQRVSCSFGQACLSADFQHPAIVLTFSSSPPSR